MLLHHHLGKLESTQYRRGHPLCVLNSISGTLNFHLSSYLGIRGADCGFVSACASSSHALGFAFDEITLGRQDCMIVVGAEELSAESFLPFHSMGALSTNPDPGSASRGFALLQPWRWRERARWASRSAARRRGRRRHAPTAVPSSHVSSTTPVSGTCSR